MRAGGCSVQQALSNDAATVIKHAVTLARRRGHAQVTPLHVASTMLSSSSGLLRTACLQSQSHPLQCKALELCFNVALNRLPTASSASPLLGHSYSHHPHPSISNGLIAAFKRAQAHERRGSSVDNQQQQQQLSAVKIELEQLMISILDDPTVSRVMREADFSSTKVKSNVEQAVVSLEFCSKSKESTALSSQAANKQITAGCSSVDVSKVMEHMIAKKKRNTVVVGELAESVESVIQGLKVKLEKGDVPDVLRDVKFTVLPLHTLPSFSKEEVDQKLGEIRSFVRDSHYTKKGLILFIGDLKWVADSWTRGATDHHGIMRNKIHPYPSVEHIVMELGKLAASYARFWIMGVATFQNYVRCRDGYPSIQSLLDLQAVNISADNNWALSLNTDSESRSLSRPTSTCSHSDQPTTSSSSLPKWLQQCKNEIKKPTTLDHRQMQECIPVTDLCKKWKSRSATLFHKQQSSQSDEQCALDKTAIFSAIPSPSSSTNYGASFAIDHYIRSSSCYEPTHQKVWPPDSKSSNNGLVFISDHTCPFSSNPILSSSCNGEIEKNPSVGKFEEVNVDSLKKMCSALEMKVPWQKDIIPEIARTVLHCRSGKMKRKGKCQNIEEKKLETWLYFQGVDIDGKERIARELARVMFGSYTKFVSISLSNFSSPRADSSEDLAGNKRDRDEQSGSYIERIGEEVANDPHRVFLVEDIEQADFCSQLGIKKAIEFGRIMTSTFQEVNLCDAIVILSCESFSSRSRASSPSQKPKLVRDGHQDKKDISGLNVEAMRPCVTLDLDLNIPMDDDDGCTEDQSSEDEIGILDSVDKRVIFKLSQYFNGY